MTRYLLSYFISALFKGYLVVSAVLVLVLCRSPCIDASELILDEAYTSDDVLTYVSVSDDALFSSDAFLPGYGETAFIDLKNSGSSDVYLRLGFTKPQTGSLALFKALRLRITDMEGKLLYTGSLDETDMIYDRLYAGSEDRLSLFLTLPADIGNEAQSQSVSFELGILASDSLEGLDVFETMEPESSSGVHGSSGGSYPLGKGYEFSVGPLVIVPTDQLVIYTSPDFTHPFGYAGGTWVLRDESRHLWGYMLPMGTFISSGFAQLYNPYGRDGGSYGWYYFDDQGYMGSGWIRPGEDIWYFGHDVSDGDLGTIKRGWHEDGSDGRKYYLSMKDGLMQTGWISLGAGDRERSYYFARLEDTYKQNWFYNTWFGRWVYDMLGDRTYGSMYVDEQTPDGRRVGSDGALIE